MVTVAEVPEASAVRQMLGLEMVAKEVANAQCGYLLVKVLMSLSFLGPLLDWRTIVHLESQSEKVSSKGLPSSTLKEELVNWGLAAAIVARARAAKEYFILK